MGSKSSQYRSVQLYQNNEKILELSKYFYFPGDKGAEKSARDVLTILGRKLPEFSAGDLIDAIALTKGGERVKYACYVHYSERRRLELKFNSGHSLQDNRRFYKIKTEINCRVISATRGENTAEFSTSLYGRIKDINLGGVFITVDNSVCFELDDYVVFSTVLGENKLKTEARVLRVQRDKVGEIVGYGCAFTDIKPNQEEMISSYITRIQIEERRLEKKKEALENE
ncbi:MAG: PilZ domain-containing protein [Oscillospiraceae bacterium]|nr:PilZ domain-containing protein [Oscillospiraceae bacterium]